MAVGDVKSDNQSVASAAFLDINPTVNEEWVIHNIYHESDISLEIFDGTNSIPFDTVTGKGVYAKFQFHLKNATHRLRVKNDALTAKRIGYDGIQSK